MGSLFQVIATGVAVMVVDRFGRRILLIQSASFMCISLVGLGVFFYMKENQCTTNYQTIVEDDLGEKQYDQICQVSPLWQKLKSLAIL